MRSPKNMEIIQIDITNACVNKCSNCTRFCGHHKKPFFMDFETFKKAVDSLKDYKGMVGIIGGEPTIHPEFEKFAKYLNKSRLNKTIKNMRQPIKEILPYVHENLMQREGHKCGLWSTLGRSYYKHFEVINDSFDTQYLNDHRNTCMHQALLMARKDMGLSDEEWIPQRDSCWIQNLWSATITPKGAFFCEVAGALDMLFDGPGGWEVTEDWWRREPKDFKDQLHWCELCSCGYDVPKRMSDDGRDDVSQTVYDKLIEVGSPKAKQGLCVIHTKEEYQANKDSYKAFTTNLGYMEDNNSQRLSDEGCFVHPKKFTPCIKSTFKQTMEKLPDDWIVVGTDNNKMNRLIETVFSKNIINPGCLYFYENIILFNVNATSLKGKKLQNMSINSIIWAYPYNKRIKYELYRGKKVSFSEKIQRFTPQKIKAIIKSI